jgi:hypothetical protein
MDKKLLTAVMALAAFAALVVGPATASATNDPQLIYSNGVPVPAGTTGFTALQVGTTALLDTSGNTLVQCTTGTGEGELIKNSGGTVEGEITKLIIGGTGAKAASEPANECTTSFGNVSVTPSLPWCLRSTPTMATDEMQVTSGKCPGGGKVKFIMVSTTVGECEYESGGPIRFDFLTSPSDAQATVRSTAAGSGVAKIRGGFLCPSSGMLNGTRTLTDASGSPLYVS